jgi:hypothetical protein
LIDQLKMLSLAEGVTLHMTLLVAFQALLARYSGHADIGGSRSPGGITRNWRI